TCPTIARLAAEIDRARRASDAGVTAVEPVATPLTSRWEDGSGPPLSFAQEQLWFFDQMEPGSPVYNLSTAVCLDGALDRNALRRALAQVAERHSVLRTTLRTFEGRPVQVVAPHFLPILHEIDLLDLAPGARQDEAVRHVAAEALVPFDLAE